MNIDEISNKTLDELKKAKKDAYPLYYKEIFNTLAHEANLDINPKLLLEDRVLDEHFLDKTHKTTEFIENTNNAIKDNSTEFLQEMEVQNLNSDIKNLVKDFETALIDKLDESNQKINELKKELNKVYKELNVDSLTKAYSRKAFQKDIQKFIEPGKDRTLDIALVALDLDHFKKINDSYGHLIGDFVLIKIVKLIKNIIRAEDKIYRLGGDEFILVFNRIKKEDITKITEKIREKIESTKLKYKDYIINLTISMGVACHIKGDTLDTWLQRADKALYDSKSSRNKVTILC
jgi:diguanylate cyclase (GGDEF)-like protein